MCTINGIGTKCVQKILSGGKVRFQKLITLLVIICSYSVAGLASSTSKSTVKNQKHRVKAAKKTRLGVDQSDFMPDEKNFGFISSYGVSYNQLEQVERKTINHSLSLAATYSFDTHWSAYLSSSVRYETLETKVFRENDSDQFYLLGNTNLGLVYSKMRPLSFVRRSSNTLNISLPTSERSQIDKTVASTSLTNYMQSYSWKKFSIFNRAYASYLWNQLKYSRTTDLINRDFAFADSLGINYSLTKRIGVRFSGRANYTRYISKQWTMSFGSNLSIFANLKGFQIYASAANNSYPENDKLDVAFYDKYRRLYSAGVTYAF